MAKNSLSFGRLLLQIALGCMLAVAGIWSFTGGGDFGVEAIRGIFSGNVGRILVIVFGVIELLAGVFLILELFMGDIFGKFDNVLMLIIIVVWIVAIVLYDFLGPKGILKGRDFMNWLYTFASHLIVLGAMFAVKD